MRQEDLRDEPVVFRVTKGKGKGRREKKIPGPSQPVRWVLGIPAKKCPSSAPSLRGQRPKDKAGLNARIRNPPVRGASEPEKTSAPELRNTEDGTPNTRADKRNRIYEMGKTPITEVGRGGFRTSSPAVEAGAAGVPLTRTIRAVNKKETHIKNRCFRCRRDGGGGAGKGAGGIFSPPSNQARFRISRRS